MEDNFYWVAVASWGGITEKAQALASDKAASIAAKEQVAQLVFEKVTQQHGDDVAKHAKRLPLALYAVDVADIDEVTLAGPQLLVMGLPVWMISLEQISV